MNRNQRKMKTSRDPNESPRPYTIPLRKYAKSSAPKVIPTSQSSPTQKNKPVQPNLSPTQQPIQKNPTASDVQQIYTDLKNPLSYSGNAEVLLNKVKSYTYVICLNAILESNIFFQCP